MNNLAIPTLFRRTLQVTGDKPGDVRDIAVRIGLPESDPVQGGDFRVLLEIEGFDRSYSRYFHGVDAIQAFLAACSVVPQLLPALAPEGARFTWLGSENLGFSIGPSSDPAPAMPADPSTTP